MKLFARLCYQFHLLLLYAHWKNLLNDRPKRIVTLLQLTYILALDRHRHFRQAAEACHVTQPSLSMQIQKLEEELGVILFDRSVRPVTPTAIGARVIVQARVVLADVERLHQIVQEATGEMAGELRVGILSTISPYLLPLVIAPFSRRYPNISLIFEEFLTGQVIDLIKRDLLDVGLIATPVSSRGIIEEPLFEEPFVGYVSPEHRLYGRAKIRTSDLHLEDLWLMSDGHCFREQTLQLLQGNNPQQANPKAIQFESGNLETLQRLVDRGYGMTLLPWLAVQGEGSHAPESVRLFEEPVPTRLIRIVYAEINIKKHLVKAFASTVRKSVSSVLPEQYIAGETE